MVSMKRIRSALERLSKAGNLLLGGKPAPYPRYKQEKPSGTVAKAWEQVGDDLRSAMSEMDEKK